MAEPERKTARPANVDDLNLLLRSCCDHAVEYLLVGGFALYAPGYQRGTTDLDIISRSTLQQGTRVRQARLWLPDKVAGELVRAGE